MQICKE